MIKVYMFKQRGKVIDAGICGDALPIDESNVADMLVIDYYNDEKDAIAAISYFAAKSIIDETSEYEHYFDNLYSESNIYAIAEDGKPQLLTTKKNESKKRTVNTSHRGESILQVDIDKDEIINEFTSQKDALSSLGLEGRKTGISDALYERKASTHIAYGYRWYFKNDWNK